MLLNILLCYPHLLYYLSYVIVLVIHRLGLMIRIADLNGTVVCQEEGDMLLVQIYPSLPHYLAVAFELGQVNIHPDCYSLVFD